jgi:hypothetical protein
MNEILNEFRISLVSIDTFDCKYTSYKQNTSLGDIQNTSSVIYSSNKFQMSSLIGNLVSSYFLSSFIEIPTSVASSSNHRISSPNSNSPTSSSAIQTTMSDDPGI